MEHLTSDSVQRLCENPECRKPATLQCPTCVKLGLDPSYFCDQECFKGFWNFHKLLHKKKETVKDDGYKYSGPLRPFPYSFSGHRKVPDHIKKPEYAKSGLPKQASDKYVPVIMDEELEQLRDTCKLGRAAQDLGHQAVAVGVTTEEIDRIVHEFIIDNDAYPSPLNYHAFPRSCCTSINEVICHGIPDSRPLQDGDIINLDISVYKNGFHADLNETYLVGNFSESSRKLVEATYESLMKAIDYCKPGSMYRECGNVISNHVEPLGYSVVRTYCGHGVGSTFHQAPNIPHYAKNKAVGFMKPMINQGVWKDMTWNDGWTSTTVDGQRSAQFEHTMVITDDGVEVLTARNENSPPLEFQINMG
ncbi:methionine aminopeptidase 1 [Stylonychia lemnae]|uniref:Methionine aminopeptidase n=1 Tax=Stylonychia lemnae TaxID=5949 RepID=A0A078A182_STYLE|nr:methionine aminopeptidase 1 [Stylonychia lemnae]|eukprot:CDW75830.1 methionine aminopeptidase 1 [Stylonychia lemnae]